MCSRHQPVEGADSERDLIVTNGAYSYGPHDPNRPFLREEVVAYIHAQDEPIQVQCGTWIENDQYEGFCTLAPDHDGRCQPPAFVFGENQ